MKQRVRGWRATWPLRLAAVATLVLVLAACRDDQPAPRAMRTVLVVQPGAAANMAANAFAGEVHARQESPLSFRIGGNLIKRMVGAGAQVKQGQVLAELDPGDAQLQASAAQAGMERLGGDLQRYRKLLAQQLVSQSAFDAQQAAYRSARAQFDLMRNQSSYSSLRAPRDGVIASRQAEAGQVVAAGQPVFVLAAGADREVAIDLPEARIRDFHTGQAALIELWNAPGQHLSGQIREIAAAADPQTRTYAARVALEGDVAAQAALGSSARVFIADPASDSSLHLPLAAVQRGDGGAAVWVVDAGNTVHLRAVRLGGYAEDSVPLLAGVNAGEWVVAGGGHLLLEGEKVAPVDRHNRPVVVQAR